MNFFLRNHEAKKVRQKLGENGLPMDEQVFCSALSYGRAKSFERLTESEFKDLKKLMNGFTHQQFLDGIYSIAFDLNVVTEKEICESNDEKIIKYLKEKNIIDSSNCFELKNAKGNLIKLNAPFPKQSFYAVSLISYLLGQIYLTRSSAMN